MADIQVGKVIHYYDKIGVAVVEVSSELALGDTIKITGQETEFIQQVNSLQIEHQQIQKVTSGQTIGLKVDQPVKENFLVWKVAER